MLDHIDLEIIRLLRQNGRLQWKQIGDQIHMTGQAVSHRITRLEELGVIEAYTVRVNESKLGNTQTVFVYVMIKEYQHTKFQSFLQETPEVVEAHRVSGEPCFILKVQVSDHNRLSALLDQILVYGYYKINVSIGHVK